MSHLSSYSVLEIRPARDSETTINSFVHFLASLNSSLKSSFLDRLFSRQSTISLELICLNQTIYFIIACPSHLEALVKSQIAAQYPSSVITVMKDYLPSWLNHGKATLAQISLNQPSFLPINTVTEQGPDHLAAILGVLSRLPAGQAAIIQIVFSQAPNSWLSYPHRLLNPPPPPPETPAPPPHPQKNLIEQKLTYPIYAIDIRLITIADNSTTANAILSQLAGSFGVYSLADGNSLGLRTLNPNSQTKLLPAVLKRSLQYAPKGQYLNLLELASLFHLPNKQLADLKNLSWGKTLRGEPPEDLTIDDYLTDDQKNKINFFARTEFKNKISLFGLKRGEDRRRHMYILGKSGTGKTTLIANMAITDVQNNEGIAVVDPHGDLADILLDHIPDHRIKDVIYLDPSTKGQSFRLNPLKVDNPEHKELAVSGILSIFTKIWANVWSARMEYILRNAFLTLVEKQGSTLMDLPKLLTNKKYRDQYLESVADPVILEFWRKEYDQYSERFQAEAIAPILNKVGRFTTSQLIRNIVGHQNSTINIEQAMNDGKILILNLAQGKIGEDNSALLGAMFITQIQIAAMNRVHIPEDQRKDFFLYVDEFQNFATDSFVKILSEARKFRLNLILANQYTAQLPEEIQKAIFGNAGTVATFVVGADDANRLINELGNQYTQDDLVGLGKYQIITKISIDGKISTPFPAYTLPLPDNKNQNRNKVIKSSQDQYYKPADLDLVTDQSSPPPSSSYHSQSKYSKPHYPPRSQSQKPAFNKYPPKKNYSYPPNQNRQSSFPSSKPSSSHQPRHQSYNQPHQPKTN